MTSHFSFRSFIVGVIVGGLLVGGWFLNTGDSSVLGTSTRSTGKQSPLSDSEAISVASQPAGETVVVEALKVSLPSVWVAVREVHGTTLGNVLGAGRATSPYASITVSLLRATEPGRSYAIELYRDDNNTAFDLAVNSVYIDFDTSAPITAHFTTAK